MGEISLLYINMQAHSRRLLLLCFRMYAYTSGLRGDTWRTYLTYKLYDIMRENRRVFSKSVAEYRDLT